MLNLLSRSKYEEFESNSALQIRNQKEKRAEEARKMKQWRRFWAGSEYFARCEISHPAKFSQGAKLPSPVPLFILLLTF